MTLTLPRATLPLRTRAEARREDWLLVGVLAGFGATFATTVVLALGYALAGALGDATGGTLSRWFAGLVDNELTQSTGNRLIAALAVNMAVGLALALVYARVVEPIIGGRGWAKGILFSLVPFVISVAVIFPLSGAGFLGSGLDAGPMPVLGNLILHLVYGYVLGAIYGIALEAGLDDTDTERATARRAERGAAVGIFVGLVVGAAVGFLVSPGLDGVIGDNATLLAGSLVGAGCGLLIGSLLGIGDPSVARVVTPGAGHGRR